MTSTNLTNRLVPETPDTDPEDFLSSSLAVIFPDAVANQHGDADTALIYTSPVLPRPLRIQLADPPKEEERQLFGHYLWNASLLAAEFIEAGTAGAPAVPPAQKAAHNKTFLLSPDKAIFDVKGKHVIELGAGTALPSMMAALLGAAQVTVTDYPSPALLATLRDNIKNNVTRDNVPEGGAASFCEDVVVEGHGWGEIDAFAETKRRAYDIVIAADCLWMPWQHTNLQTSIAHFLKPVSVNPSARAWVIAGFHTGRHQMRGFFDPASLAAKGLEVEHMWEVDCVGVEREWVVEREGEDVATRRRWLAVGILKSVAES
ncbi:hypothetical protein jhhlp_001825 [Lomentospora prolificans]|uniref:Nicotinamide N-methyltransferase n=1 Tax=Lomentospora prolificans TaxID=41688 RepID=A0A2N3NGX3_9PEZI|nr:hypothetical protein jhhlp_001825 [Lomentospora prolificans]